MNCSASRYSEEKQLLKLNFSNSDLFYWQELVDSFNRSQVDLITNFTELFLYFKKLRSVSMEKKVQKFSLKSPYLGLSCIEDLRQQWKMTNTGSNYKKISKLRNIIGSDFYTRAGGVYPKCNANYCVSKF